MFKYQNQIIGVWYDSEVKLFWKGLLLNQVSDFAHVHLLKHSQKDIFHIWIKVPKNYIEK